VDNQKVKEEEEHTKSLRERIETCLGVVIEKARDNLFKSVEAYYIDYKQMRYDIVIKSGGMKPVFYAHIHETILRNILRIQRNVIKIVIFNFNIESSKQLEVALDLVHNLHWALDELFSCPTCYIKKIWKVGDAKGFNKPDQMKLAVEICQVKETSYF